MGRRIKNKLTWVIILGLIMGVILCLIDPLGKFESEPAQKIETTKKLKLDSPVFDIDHGSSRRYKELPPEETEVKDYFSGNDNSDYDIELGTGDPDAEEMADFERD